MSYTPGAVPIVDDPELQKVLDYVKEEFAAIQAAEATNTVELRTSSAAPDKPREGMIVAADGTNWNPGSGAGTYTFTGGVWVKMGSAIHTHVMADITDAGSLATLSSVDLAHMANLAAHKVIGRDTNSTGVPEAVTPAQMLEWLATMARGDILVRGASAFGKLAIGAANTQLVSDGTDPSWGSASWATFLTALTSTSGSNQDFADIVQTYSHLLFYFDRVGGSNTCTLGLQAATSNTFSSLITTVEGHLGVTSGSSTYGTGGSGTTAQLITPNGNGLQSGFVLLLNYTSTSKYKVFLHGMVKDTTAPGNMEIGVGSIQTTSALADIRFNMSVGSWNAGSISMYGIK